MLLWSSNGNLRSVEKKETTGFIVLSSAFWTFDSDDDNFGLKARHFDLL
jgi:hypothetical protein